MRHILFATAAVMALATSMPAFAQVTPPTSPTGARPGNVIGTGMSEPTSTQASNINRSDTRSPIAPRLPAPPAADGGSPADLLRVARNALRGNRTGAAQESMERAETRLLDRSTPQGADPASSNEMVRQISAARNALASGDRGRAAQIIDQVLAAARPASASNL